jgi:adenylate cyclase
LADQYVSNFVILNVDLKGSTELTRKISLSTHSLLIGLYSREMALIVDNYHGFVLKYLGDGIIAYFPLPAIWGIDDNALDCAVMMKILIERGMNKVLRDNNMPTVSFRIGLDTGKAIVTTVGDSSNKLHKDLIGNAIDLTTKIQGVAPINNIAVGNILWKRLGVHRRKRFKECTPIGWNHELPSVLGYTRSIA